MDILIRRAALRATAKVALSLTVVGCGANVDSIDDEEAYSRDDGYATGKGDDVGEPADDAPDGAVEDANDDADCSDEEELACGLGEGDPSAIEEIALDDAQLLCCAELLEPLTPSWDEEGSWEAWQESQADPEVAGCCGVAVAHVNADYMKIEQVGWDTLNACCGAIGNPMGPACTPWGPPVPPAIDALPSWEVA
jgi:hypothetical protein